MAHNIDIKAEFLHGTSLKLLSKRLDSRALAIGYMVEFWELAQGYWAAGRQKIPKKIFDDFNFPKHLLDPLIGVAEVHGDEIYAVGSEQHFDWILRKREAGRSGGIQSGISRTKIAEHNKINNLDGSKPEANPKQTRSKLQANSKQTEPPIPIPIPIPIPKEYNKSASEFSLSSKTTPSLDWFVEAWNNNCGMLPKCNGVSPKRRKSIIARVKENSSQDYWAEVVKRIVKSGFCRGTNDRAWKASFDWFIQPDTHLKVLEGKYDDRGLSPGPNRSSLEEYMKLKDSK